MFRTIKKTLVFCFKLTIILGIFGFLFWKASQATDANGKNVFELLWEQPKRWELLGAAFFVQLFAVSVTIWRWRCLVQTLGLELSVKNAFRLGFLGLMLNLAPMGIVGGDLIKSYLIAKKNPDYMSQAVASVIVDRIVGLLVMFLCGAVFVCITGFAFRQEVFARTLSQLVFILTITGYVCVGIVFLPFFSKGHTERLLAKIPFCGKVLGKLAKSFLLYRNHKICLLQTFAMTFLVHIPFGFSLYLIAEGLFGSVPNVIDHIMLYNVVNLTAMIPLAAGPFEFVLEQTYPLFSAEGIRMGVGIGLVVALGYRLISIFVAGLGIVYYLSSRDEIREVVG
jgi:uncharacterized protein (TIRG00374 family)